MQLFPVSVAIFARETNSFITNMHFINSYYPWKNVVKQLKPTPKNCHKGITSTPLLRSQTLVIVKIQQNHFLGFYYLSGFDLLNMHAGTCSVFLNLFDGQFGHFVLRTSIKSILSSIICVLLNVEIFSRNYILFSRAHLSSQKVLL